MKPGRLLKTVLLALGLGIVLSIGMVGLGIYTGRSEDRPAERPPSPPLYEAAVLGDIGQVRALIAKGTDVDVQGGRYGETPLHQAVRHGRQDIAILLMAHGADINRAQKEGYTPLHLALRLGQRELAGMLLDRGANVKTHTLNRETPMHDAARLGDGRLVERLVTAGLGINAKNTRGATPLLAAMMTTYGFKLDERRDVIERLVGLGADVNVQNILGDTPPAYCREPRPNGACSVLDCLWQRHRCGEREGTNTADAYSGTRLLGCGQSVGFQGREGKRQGRRQ